MDEFDFAEIVNLSGNSIWGAGQDDFNLRIVIIYFIMEGKPGEPLTKRECFGDLPEYEVK